MNVLIGAANAACALLLLFYVRYSTQLDRRNRTLLEMYSERASRILDLEQNIERLRKALLDAHLNADYHRNRQDVARLELDNRKRRAAQMQEELAQSRRMMGR